MKMTRITFRSPNYENGECITLKEFNLDDSKVFCNQCGTELSQREMTPSVITFIEGEKYVHNITYITKYLCFNCIEKLTGRRPDHE